MRRSWIKLYVEFLDDPKVGTLPEVLQLRFIKLCLVAAERDKDGELPDPDKLAWRLRLPEAEVTKNLTALKRAGLTSQRQGKWIITKFAERQAAVSNTERVQEWRKRHGNENGTNDVTKRSMNGNETARKKTLLLSYLPLPLPPVPLWYERKIRDIKLK